MAYTITHECVGCSVCMRVCPVDAIVGKPKERHRIVSEICIDCGACGRICPYASVKDPGGSSVRTDPHSLTLAQAGVRR